MNRILLFCACCAFCALWGCRTLPEASPEAIALSASTSEHSKTDALAAGDDVAVWACLEGTEEYFLEGAKFTVGTDGRSLITGTPVYYPDSKQAVRFYAYFPYHTGVFSVPTDQSTASALKQADLCWATASSTPVTTPVPLGFTHQMARLIITTNNLTSKIVAPNVFSGGTLDINTGTFLNTTKSEVSTTGTELILLAQPLTRLILTANGVAYVYEGSINLQSGQTTSLHLTLHPNTKTATLNGSSVTEWVASTTQGIPEQAVSNVLTLHWPQCPPEASTVNKIILTIKDQVTNTTTSYTLLSGISYTNQTFTIPFASANLRYPYTITSVQYYNHNTEILPISTVLVGQPIHKSGLYVLGVKRNPLNPPLESDYIVINGLKWAKGNLIAISSTASNMNGCKIGAPTDIGLLFQFGSLIGWRSGSAALGGTGAGLIPQSWTGAYWNGERSFSWENSAVVWPVSMSKYPTSFPNHQGTVQGSINTFDYFFNYNVAPYASYNTNIRDYPGLISEKLASLGVGDVCSYYLGASWRLPRASEILQLCNNIGGINETIENIALCGVGYQTTPFWGFTYSNEKLFLPLGQLTTTLTGTYDNYFSKNTQFQTSDTGTANTQLTGGSAYSGYLPSRFAFVSRYTMSRSIALPVRCVSEAP